MDNGGDVIKYGWSTDQQPQHIPNVTARLPAQWTVLAGDQLASISNPNQLIGVTRSMERGIITNLGNQVQVWKRMLELLNVTCRLSTETAKAFGWKVARPGSSAAAVSDTATTTPIKASTCAILLTVPPHSPRSVLDQILQVWLEDFGFAHVGLSVASTCAAVQQAHADYRTCCLVDLGWSAMQIVPMYEDKVIDAAAIRRLGVAGRHLINMWKYFASYRQWNLMDQEWILKDVLHQTGFVSRQFKEDIGLAKKVPAGRRPYDREYLLPDQQNNFQGSVRLPLALRKQADGQDEENESDDEDDEDVDENEMEAEEDEDDHDVAENEEELANSDDEESPAEIRRRLLKQREEEQRHRREMEEEQQVLNVTVERFTIPEALFRPSDVGLPSDWANLPAAIVQSISACPKALQAALFQSIHLVGGLSQLSNLKERLEQELRALAPCEFGVVITASESPVDQAWSGACKLAEQGTYTDWSVSLSDYDAVSKRGAWKRLLVSNGGHLI